MSLAAHLEVARSCSGEANTLRTRVKNVTRIKSLWLNILLRMDVVTTRTMVVRCHDFYSVSSHVDRNDQEIRQAAARKR